MKRNSDIWQILEKYFEEIFKTRILEKVQMKHSNIWKIQFEEKSIQRRKGKDKINEMSS